MESVRMLMQLAVRIKWLLHQMDAKGGYLHALIECDVYVSQPLGHEITDKDRKTLVWKLKKSLYSFKQSGRNWHNVLMIILKN